MKGVIFNIVEEAITASRGEMAWDMLLERAGVGGSWTAIGDYPHEELLRLIEAGSALLGMDADELTRRLGHDALLGLARRYPEFVDPHHETTSFLLSLNDVIHPEVRKLQPTASPPSFGFERAEDGSLLIDYHSHRDLCRLVDGMVRGSASWYGEVASVRHQACVRDGAPHCRLRSDFAPAESGTATGGPHREMAAS